MDPRKALKGAHERLQTAQEAVDEAASIHDRASRFVGACEQEAAAFNDVQMAVNAERAENVRSALASGLTRSMMLSPALLERLAAKREAETKLESARRALGVLKADLESAEAAEAKAKGYVADCARGVLEGAAEVLAEDLQNLENEAMVRRCCLMAVEGLWAASSDGHSRPLRLSQQAQVVMADIGTVAKINSHNSTEARLRDSEAMKWQSYASRLLADPAAEFEAGDGDDLPLAVPVPQAPNIAGVFQDLNPNARARQQQAAE